MAGYVNLAGGRYVLSGGLLELSGGLQLAGGTLSGGTTAGVIQGGVPGTPGRGTIVDLSQGSLVNTADISLSLGANSLVIVSQGFNPAAVFQTYSNPGMTHTLGTTLTVSVARDSADGRRSRTPWSARGASSPPPAAPST